MGGMKRDDKIIESYMEHLDPDFRLEHRKKIGKDIETVKKELDIVRKRVIIGGKKGNKGE